MCLKDFSNTINWGWNQEENIKRSFINFFCAFYSFNFVVKFLILLYQFSRESSILTMRENTRQAAVRRKKRDKLEDRAGNWWGADQWMLILDILYIHYTRISNSQSRERASKLETLWIRDCNVHCEHKAKLLPHISLSRLVPMWIFFSFESAKYEHTKNCTCHVHDFI